jgi:tRNA(Ser,Leu) C12 N-acetylase TAN1
MSKVTLIKNKDNKFEPIKFIIEVEITSLEDYKYLKENVQELVDSHHFDSDVLASIVHYLETQI